MPFNLPFVQLTRNMVLDNVAVSECKTVKISGCFLCGIKPLADFRSLPETVTRQEKASLFRNLLINPTIRKNTSPSSYNQFMSTTESCSDCLSLIKEVCARQQEIVALEKELENRLEESRRKYFNGCEIVANTLTVGRIKLHAGGQDNSSTLAGLSIPARKFSPVQMSPEIEDDERISRENEEDMSLDEEENTSSEWDEDDEEDKPSEFAAEKENMSIDEEEASDFDEEEEYTPPNGKPTGRTMQSNNKHSTNATVNDWICLHCGKDFRSKEYLKRHKENRVCTKTRPPKIEGPFACSKCFKLFPTRRCQITHEMHVCNIVYTQEQAEPMTLYTCSLCSKQFVNLCDYQRHYGIHSKVKKLVVLDQLPRRHQDNHTSKYVNECEILGNSLTGGRIKLHAVGQDHSSAFAGLSTPPRKFSPRQMSPDVEDNESIDPDEDENMSSEFDEEEECTPPNGKPTGRTLQAKYEHSNNATINHYGNHSEVKKSVVLDQLPRRHRDNHTPARNVSFVAGKSVDSVRQPQDNRSPRRNVSPIADKEISPYEPLLGGKLTIHHCPHCTGWFVKEDNLRTHLATNHRAVSTLLQGQRRSNAHS
ncbi:uncharacterized protein LOC110861932 [Folsomia candida]|uniref:uncharacterized protein LOC110861932 n=1 Tax=Folsomia candida TaxID=158441 RepID=UPI0016053C96|nr:uncharacterized protein LOC110861932 [Folsomia candida]